MMHINLVKEKVLKTIIYTVIKDVPKVKMIGLSHPYHFTYHLT